MILQALVSYYEALAQKGEIAQPGWAPAKVSYALELNDDGKITNIISLRQPDKGGKKLLPRVLEVPAQVKRSSGISPNFLCDNCAYVFGVAEGDKAKRSEDCFTACKTLHHKYLDGLEEDAAKAVLLFFDTWEASAFSDIVPEEERRADLLKGANLVFFYQGQFVQTIPSVRQAWQKNYLKGEGVSLPCLVTGEIAPAAKLHPSIKGIAGAQSSGASLVSYNAPAFCSFNREQGLNAPTSEYAAFAYGAALNYLIATQDYNRIGDTTVLFWAENGVNQYRSMMNFCCFGKVPENYSSQDLRSIVRDIVAGRPSDFDSERLDPNMNFYLLGLSPNAARLSVRFFFRRSFGEFIRNIEAHQERLEITPRADRPITIWELVNETVNQKSKDKMPSPNMAGEMLRAILNNTAYPSTLLNGIRLRIRADRTINRNRAAMVKAYYLKRPHPDISKEVLQMSLNPECTDEAYVLGRMFSVLEHIQSCANPGINTTIRDRYFNSASATPSVVFPTLVNLAQKHLKKIRGGLAVTLDRQLTDIIGMLGTGYPIRLSLPQQGAFQLGYYHQTAVRFTKKEENNQ